MRDFMRRLFGFRRRDPMAARYAEETKYHLEMQTARNVAAGMTPDEARRAAMVAFGGHERFGEAAKDEVRSVALEELARDVRFTLRGLRRAPAFATAAILTLALGIGATTVIFSVTDHVVLRPLDYEEPERLVLLREVIEQIRDRMPSLPANAGHYLTWRAQCTTCQDVAAILPIQMTLLGDGDPQRVSVGRASANFLPLLGARLLHGRGFTAEEDAEGAERVAILTYGFWQRQFGGRTDILGQSIRLGAGTGTVIGILEPDFKLPSARELGSPAAGAPAGPDLFIPLALAQWERESPGMFNYLVMARLKPGVTTDQLDAELERFAAGFSAAHSDGMTFQAEVVPLQEQVVGATGRALVLLLAAVGALLAIVCVNLANLLLVRNAARVQESAVRIAIGAGRARLVRQALTESLVLALAGGALGMLLSYWGLNALLHYAPATLPRIDEITLDGRVLAVALLVSLAAGVIFGVLPALRFGRTDPAEALRSQGGRTATEARGSLRAREVLVGTQVALSALLLVATGLFLSSFMRVLRVDRGFDVEQALAVDVTLPVAAYREAPRRVQFYDEAMQRLNALPGVTVAATATALPLEGDIQVDVLSLEHDDRAVAERPLGSIRYVSASYFEALGTPLLAGRLFTDADRGRRVTVLSERAAQALWPNESALGKRVWPGSNDSIAEVIGVVAELRTSSLEAEGTPIAYVPFWENPQYNALLFVRTAGEPTSAAAGVRGALRELAPTVPVSRVRTIEEVVSAAVAHRRFQLFVLALFAVTALATASVGIYGVVAHSLRRRTAEIGVRMALGAQPGDVQRLVLREGVAPVLLGLTAGLTGAVALGAPVRALLFGVSPSDPVTLGGVALVLTLVAALACWIPARRATRMDVVQALRRD